MKAREKRNREREREYVCAQRNDYRFKRNFCICKQSTVNETIKGRIGKKIVKNIRLSNCKTVSVKLKIDLK